MTRMKRGLRFAVAPVALVALIGAAQAKMAVVTIDTPACTSWAGWHEWLLASMTDKGAAPNKNCPTMIDKGTKVELVEGDDGEGAATIRWKRKTWYTHADRLREQ